MLFFSGISIVCGLLIIIAFKKLERVQLDARDRGLGVYEEYKSRAKNDVRPESLYRKRAKVLTHSETAFFHELERQLQPGLRVFPKMRIADVVQTTNGRSSTLPKNKLLMKHLDFVICNEWLQPLLAIELNGIDHELPHRQASEELKQQVLGDAGLPLVMIKVGDTFTKEITDLLDEYDLGNTSHSSGSERSAYVSSGTPALSH